MYDLATHYTCKKREEHDVLFCLDVIETRTVPRMQPAPQLDLEQLINECKAFIVTEDVDTMPPE